MTTMLERRYLHILDEICSYRWEAINQDELTAVAHAYYFFSVQFRENLLVACDLFPGDERLILLRDGECDTDNLSPYPGIAASGERMNHDEFMRRLVVQAATSNQDLAALETIGNCYLADARSARPDGQGPKHRQLRRRWTGAGLYSDADGPRIGSVPRCKLSGISWWSISDLTATPTAGTAR